MKTLKCMAEGAGLPLLLLICTVPLFLAGCRDIDHADPEPHTLVVLSLDGFRWDYSQLYSTPNLDALAEGGIRAEFLIPAFPTKTFPNHYTLATGLFPDHHGLVNNSFMDPATGRLYSIGDREAVGDGFFYGGEPVWNTAEQQGIRTAICFWVGSEADIQGMRPSRWKPYDHDMAFVDRMDTVMAWLELPLEERPGLIMWYLHEPDAVGHTYGPESIETGEMVEYLDSLVGVFIRRMKRLPHYETINLIILSDHGMTEISNDRVIWLNDHIPPHWIRTARGGSPVINIQAAEGFYETLLHTLEAIPHLVVAANSATPPSWHYGTHPRCLDITVTADPGWSIGWERGRTFEGGAHGYDPTTCPDMNAIFYACGPSFEKGHTIPAFKNIHVYELMCKLLGITPSPNDGNLENISIITEKK
ncbi:MAG TPA: alkaline phosphatase family protein [Bacteroidetes bacterium]|nr:alkaline phosphatase family protein [Bacteroidota bacterium]